MELHAFFAMVTGLKTACTHAGLDPKTATIRVDASEGTILAVEVRGEGKHGSVVLQFIVD
jgi:hypothetical protein